VWDLDIYFKSGLAPLQELTGQGSDSPLTAVSHWSPGESGGSGGRRRHTRSVSVGASMVLSLVPSWHTPQIYITSCPGCLTCL
jgi:hypothetical protein